MRLRGILLALLVGAVGCHSFDEVSICESDPQQSVSCPGNPEYCFAEQTRCNGRVPEHCIGAPGRWVADPGCEVACSAAVCVRAVDVVGAEDGACAVFEDGTVRCWGMNNAGQLGDGTTQMPLAPVAADFLRGARWISMGSGHACAVLSGGTVSCWGGNESGQLGDGTMVARLTPRLVQLPSEAVATAVTTDSSCALAKDGDVYCWGAGGVLGSSENVLVPQSVIGLESSASKLVAAGRGYCALIGETIECWGLDLPDVPTRLGASPVTKVQGSFKSLSAFDHLACGTSTDDKLLCWGANSVLRWPGSIDQPYEASAWNGGLSISVGGDHLCGIYDGVVRCAGSNRYGQLCNGSTTDTTQQVPVSGLPVITKVVSAVASNCMLTIDGSVFCCGKTDEGAAGPNLSGNNLLPTRISF